MSSGQLSIAVADEAGMMAPAARLAAAGRSGIIYLRGDLGAGKSTLARAYLHSRGYQGRVKSPTYTLIESYQLPDGPVHHLDLYRLQDPEELEFIGLRDLFVADAMILIEWPEKGMELLPEADLEIVIKPHGQGRILLFQSHTDKGQEFINALSGLADNLD